MNKNCDNYIYIISDNVRNTIKIHEICEKNSIKSTLDPAPEHIIKDCTIVVKIKKEFLQQIEKLLLNENLSYKIFINS